MTDEIEIPDPLGEAKPPKPAEPAPELSDATVIEAPLPRVVVPEPVIEVTPTVDVASPVEVQPVVEVPPAAPVNPAPQVATPIEAPRFTETVAAASPPAVESPKKNNTIWWVIGIIVLLLLCCCCIILIFPAIWLWNNGDELLQDLSYQLLPLLQTFLAL